MNRSVDVMSSKVGSSSRKKSFVSILPRVSLRSNGLDVSNHLYDDDNDVDYNQSRTSLSKRLMSRSYRLKNTSTAFLNKSVNNGYDQPRGDIDLDRSHRPQKHILDLVETMGERGSISEQPVSDYEIDQTERTNSTSSSTIPTSASTNSLSQEQNNTSHYNNVPMFATKLQHESGITLESLPSISRDSLSLSKQSHEKIIGKVSSKPVISALANGSRTTTRCKASLSWGVVELRTYETILGDNPSVATGPPVSLGWDVLHVNTIDLDDYESYRTDETIRRREDLLLPRIERERRLMEFGFSRSEMTQREREIDAVKKSRFLNTRNISHNPFYRKLLPFSRGNSV